MKITLRISHNLNVLYELPETLQKYIYSYYHKILLHGILVL